jgi:hypothetical protein
MKRLGFIAGVSRRGNRLAFDVTSCQNHIRNAIRSTTRMTVQMKNNSNPLKGPGRFQWSAGGWFGSSLGSSAWTLVTSYFLVVHHQPFLAAIAASGFLAILIASLVLWTLREQVFPFTALMAILSLMAFTLPMVWLVVLSYGSAEAKNAMNWPISPWPTVFVFALIPSLMIWFAYLERLVIFKTR